MQNNIIQSDDFIVGYNQEKPIVADLSYTKNETTQPLVIFCHGYKGYKDWGAWHLVAKRFAEQGFIFLKFNFSHNGGTFENPIDFPDLEAFGLDNYSKQMQDLESVISFALNDSNTMPKVDYKNISLIGHSRGGGITCLMANENSHVSKLITWAGVSDYKSRFPKGKKLEEWKKQGAYYVKNGRTHQDMPHYIQFYEDFLANESRLNIQHAVENLKIPYLILHGEEDETVDLEEAKKLNDWCKHAEMKFIPNATHTFNTKQPWGKSELSKELRTAVDLSIDFLKPKS
jgi:dienelactone hydrolase